MSGAGGGLCPYRGTRDISIMNEENKARHTRKCKKEHPYPLFKPVKTKQTKLSFAPAPFPSLPPPEPLPDHHFEVETPIPISTTLSPSGLSVTSQQSSSSTSETTSEQSPSTSGTPSSVTPSLVVQPESETKLYAATETTGLSGKLLAVVDDVLFDSDYEDDVVVTGALHSSICNGFLPGIPDFHASFPFHLLPSLSHIVISGATFHHISCSKNHFKLVASDSSNVNPRINEQCQLLGVDEKLSGILKRSALSVEELPATLNNTFLSHKQLSMKCTTLRQERNLLQLELLRKSKQLSRLNKVLALHKRFMVLLAENNVLRVKELVCVALKHKRSISYIVDKVTMAIGKIYRARPSQEDKDLAFIVLKLGGPTLLSILCKANKLPSTSLAYRMGRELKPLNSPVTNSATQCIQNNLDVDFFKDSSSTSLKMDETFLSPRLRYDVRNNTFQGVCYQHAPSDLHFDTFEDLESVVKLIKDDLLHVPKENLVVGVNRHGLLVAKTTTREPRT